MRACAHTHAHTHTCIHTRADRHTHNTHTQSPTSPTSQSHKDTEDTKGIENNRKGKTRWSQTNDFPALERRWGAGRILIIGLFKQQVSILKVTMHLSPVLKKEVNCLFKWQIHCRDLHQHYCVVKLKHPLGTSRREVTATSLPLRVWTFLLGFYSCRKSLAKVSAPGTQWDLTGQ